MKVTAVWKLPLSLSYSVLVGIVIVILAWLAILEEFIDKVFIALVCNGSYHFSKKALALLNFDFDTREIEDQELSGLMHDSVQKRGGLLTLELFTVVFCDTNVVL